MHCYQYLAAITAVAHTLESIPEIEHKLPHAVIADWLAVNNIEAEDMLNSTPQQVATIVEPLVHENRPRILNAA